MTKAPRQVAPPITDEEEARIQAGIAADPDNPELTDEQLAAIRPASEVLPTAMLEALVKRRSGQRGPGKRPAKMLITLRLDRDVVEGFKASGEGWQTRMNDTLRRALRS